MAIFGKLKQALGFTDIDEEDYNSNEESPNVRPSQNMKEPATISIVAEETLPNEIFDKVVKIFNESLPEFLKANMDVAAQRQYIYNSLNEGMKEYLNKLSSEARQRGEGKWSEERARLQKEIAQLKDQNKNVDEQRSEWKKQQLSAERQKRAMAERLHDLEKLVATLEAEKEQYDLENKSLLNKIKVSSVLDGDMEAMRQEITDLKAQLQKARQEALSNQSEDAQAQIEAANAAVTEKENEIVELKEQIAILEAEPVVDVEEKQAEIEQLNTKVTELSTENARLSEMIEQLKAKEAISDAMINDLNSKASSAMQQLKEKEEYIATISVDNAADDSEVEELKGKLALANEEMEAMREELDEARATMQALDEIQEQMDRFEELKKKKDAKIAELQEDAKRYIGQITQLEKDTESLKKTIEHNLYKQGEVEQALRKEINELKSQAKPAATQQPISLDDVDDLIKTIEVKSTPKPKKRVKISAIDESLDDTDWLVATPPPGTVTRPTPSTTDEDFGYQSPSRKSTPENDAQMSLF